MNQRHIILIFTAWFMTCALNIKAQPGYQLPFLQGIGTSVNVRPSTMPDNDYCFSIPLLPVLNFEFDNSGLDYHHALSITNQEAFLNLDRLVAEVKPRNTLGLQLHIDLLNAGFKTPKGYWSMNVTDRADFKFIYTDDFINLLFRGNGPYIGRTVDLSHCGFDASHFWDIGVGYTRQINTFITAGIRIKRLIGMDNISTDIQSLTATTRSNDYTLQLSSNTIVNASSPLIDNWSGTSNSGGLDQPIAYISGRGNGGWGINFGLRYQVNAKLNVSFDALDVGKIRWVSNAVNYRLDKGNYSFSGISLNQLLHQEADSASYVDSLAHAFPTTETRQPYSTSLPSTLLLSGEYSISPSTAGILSVRGVFFHGQLLPSFNLMLRKELIKHIGFSLNYAYRYDRVNLLGLGVYVNAGPFNIFVLSDNLPGTFYPLRGKSASVNIGCLFTSREKRPRPSR